MPVVHKIVHETIGETIHDTVCEKIVHVQIVDQALKVWVGIKWNGTNLIELGWRRFALYHCLEEHNAIFMQIVAQTEEAITLTECIFQVVPIPDSRTAWNSHILPPHWLPNQNAGIQTLQF